MTTKWIPASRLTTRRQLVEPGPRKREVRKICEIVQNGQTVQLRVRVGDAIESRTFHPKQRACVVA